MDWELKLKEDEGEVFTKYYYRVGGIVSCNKSTLIGRQFVALCRRSGRWTAVVHKLIDPYNNNNMFLVLGWGEIRRDIY